MSAASPAQTVRCSNTSVTGSIFANSSTHLVAINKIRVLFVREVLKCRSIKGFGVAFESTILSQGCTRFLLLSVFPFESKTKYEEENELNKVGNQQRSNPQVIRRRLGRLVEEGPGNTAYTRPKPYDARNYHLLRMTSGIARYQR